MKSASVFVAAASACVAGVALAGSRFAGSGDVVIGRTADGGYNAAGYIGMVYNSPNANQYIGCDRYSDDVISCRAFDGTNFAFCSVRSAFLAQSIDSVSSDARLVFTSNAAGACTRIVVQHSSEYADKQ